MTARDFHPSNNIRRWTMTRHVTVKRKGYIRRDYTAMRTGRPTTEVRGAGRGPRIVPSAEEESLGGAEFFDRPIDERHAVEARLAKEQGEKRVIAKLRAIQIFNKRV